MIEISKEFGFDAAHYLGNSAPENRRLHGHSFYAEVTLRGEPDPVTAANRLMSHPGRTASASHVSLFRAHSRG